MLAAPGSTRRLRLAWWLSGLVIVVGAALGLLLDHGHQRSREFHRYAVQGARALVLDAGTARQQWPAGTLGPGTGGLMHVESVDQAGASQPTDVPWLVPGSSMSAPVPDDAGLSFEPLLVHLQSVHAETAHALTAWRAIRPPAFARASWHDRRSELEAELATEDALYTAVHTVVKTESPSAAQVRAVQQIAAFNLRSLPDDDPVDGLAAHADRTYRLMQAADARYQNDLAAEQPGLF